MSAATFPPTLRKRKLSGKDAKIIGNLQLINVRAGGSRVIVSGGAIVVDLHGLAEVRRVQHFPVSYAEAHMSDM
jgi:hypothetical protein